MKKPNYNFAAIFDMDGVVVDNTKYHILAWKKFAKELGVKVTDRMVREKFLGRFGPEILRMILPKNFDRPKLKKFNAEREVYYRKIYAKAIRPVEGLKNLLSVLQKNKIKVALATSAPPENVRFVMSKTKLRKYFHIIIDDRGVKKGKPNPDIFLKAARHLKTKPEYCVVFEDAMMGIQAAQRAGMKVIAISTTHKPRDVAHADLVIKNFSALTLKKINLLFNK